MAYVALYRAYRPQKFSEVVGQTHIIKTLQNALKMDKVAHAYLFCGPRGTGKTSIAKIVAKALNCESGNKTEPCCKCEICEGITKGTIADVVEIDAASNNGVDDVRAIRDTVKFLPSVGKYKVYIIDEVHMLSQAAFNALLKTLEEPPAHVIFILATTEPYKLPKTILSRCQRFDFQALSLDNLLKRLKIVADEEHIKITEEALHQIAISAEGGMRDALSIFDQCISYNTSDEITLDDVLKISGNISYFKMIELLNSCINSSSTNCISILDKIINEGKEIPRIINDLILFLRDVLMFKNNAQLDDKLMYKNKDFILLSSNLNKGVIYNWLDILNQALNDMRFSTQKRAYLELALLKMSDLKLNDYATLSSRLESVENSLLMIMDNYKNQRQIEPEKKEIKNVDIPSKEDLLKYRDEPQNVRDTETQLVEPIIENKNEIVDIPDDEITVDDISNILNESTKDRRAFVENIFRDIENKYQYVYVQILTRGKVIAASTSAFIVELADIKFCNRVMMYENYLKIIEIMNEYDINIKDYICIPREAWNILKEDFRRKYSPSNPKPKLDPIRIGVKKRIMPKNEDIKKEDPLVENAKNLLGDDLVEIEE